MRRMLFIAVCAIIMSLGPLFGQGTTLVGLGNVSQPDTATYRCNFQGYAIGDYARIRTNPYLAVDAPYVKLNSTRRLNELFQVFDSDPDTQSLQSSR